MEKAVAEGGSAASFGLARGEAVAPDPDLTAQLRRGAGRGGQGGDGRQLRPRPGGAQERLPSGAGAADLQTVAILARARSLGIAAAAILIVAEGDTGELLGDTARDDAAKRAGRSVCAVF